MDLKTFVAETLSQILEGIREAQSKEGGDEINADADSYSPPTGGRLFSVASGIFTRVEFDVAVSAESEGGGRAASRCLASAP